jgi:hypothetical protein
VQCTCKLARSTAGTVGNSHLVFFGNLGIVYCQSLCHTRFTCANIILLLPWADSSPVGDRACPQTTGCASAGASSRILPLLTVMAGVVASSRVLSSITLSAGAAASRPIPLRTCCRGRGGHSSSAHQAEVSSAATPPDGSTALAYWCGAEAQGSCTVNVLHECCMSGIITVTAVHQWGTF